jgi:hypothetical protein
MKGTAIVVALAVLGITAMSATSCVVNRRSGDLACETNADCHDNRTCDRGYCVEHTGDCPGPCTSCDLGAMTCKIECSAGKPCGDVQCPFGYDCTIDCNNASACGSIDCVPGTKCNISCSGARSCGPINCGLTECKVECSGASSCPSIDCAAACSCDVDCTSALACPSMSCPQGLDYCAKTTSAGEVCDSTAATLCDRCL